MTKVEKILAKMRNNPRDWKIEDIKAIADRFKIEYRQPGTSHVTFRVSTGEKVTIPAHKPIKTNLHQIIYCTYRWVRRRKR